MSVVISVLISVLPGRSSVGMHFLWLPNVVLRQKQLHHLFVFALAVAPAHNLHHGTSCGSHCAKRPARIQQPASARVVCSAKVPSRKTSCAVGCQWAALLHLNNPPANKESLMTAPGRLGRGKTTYAHDADARCMPCLCAVTPAMTHCMEINQTTAIVMAHQTVTLRE